MEDEGKMYQASKERLGCLAEKVRFDAQATESLEIFELVHGSVSF